jgi:acid phosphatase type 7
MSNSTKIQIVPVLVLLILSIFFSTAFAAIAGDINGDSRVDILDFQLLSNSFGKSQGQTGYNASADLNADTRIDILDFQLVSNNFGRIGPTNAPTIAPQTPTITRAPTQSPIGQTITTVAVGDIACGPDTAPGMPCKEWYTSEVARTANPNAVLVLGDLQYDAGQLANFNGTSAFCQSNPPRCYNGTWGRLKSITYPAVGNHEYGTPGASGYFDYFNGAGNQTGRAGDRSKGYYSYNLGSWHFVVLNSNCTKIGCGTGSAQETWLRQDLAQNTHLCTVAYLHHSKFSSGHDGNNTAITSTLLPLWQALYDHNADLILSGHSHSYERFAPMTPQGTVNNTRGIRSFVVGTGGRDFTGFWGNAPNSQSRNNNTFGVLKLTMRPSSYDWQFLPIQGQTFTDSGSANCH